MTNAPNSATAVAEKPKTSTATTIVDVASADDRFKTLVAAVKAAGLVETLKGNGPFTVFAPTEAAFAKLPAGTVDALLKDKAKLTSILTYHVMPGKIHAADLKTMADAHGKVTAKTVNGHDLVLEVTAAGVHLGADHKAAVVAADVDASNGVIHAIDTVLMPPTP
jgi:uncharacterized surface protein with fasciclin (FAS1) repeats